MMWQNIFQDVQSKLNEPSAIFSFAPVWIVSALLLVGAFAVAWLIHAIVLATLRRIFGDRRPYLSQVIAATKNPTRLALLLAALAIALPAAPLGSDTRLVLVRCLMLATICSIGWIALIVLHIAADFFLRNFRIDAEDNPLARKHITQVRVLVRVLDTIIILLTLGIALMTFAEVRPVWGQPLRLGRRCRCAFSSRSITGRAAPRPNIGLDYTAPIERIRNKAIELVGQSTQPAAGSSQCRSPMPRPTPSSCGSC